MGLCLVFGLIACAILGCLVNKCSVFSISFSNLIASWGFMLAYQLKIWLKSNLASPSYSILYAFMQLQFEFFYSFFSFSFDFLPRDQLTCSVFNVCDSFF